MVNHILSGSARDVLRRVDVSAVGNEHDASLVRLAGSLVVS